MCLLFFFAVICFLGFVVFLGPNIANMSLLFIAKLFAGDEDARCSLQRCTKLHMTSNFRARKEKQRIKCSNFSSQD